MFVMEDNLHAANDSEKIKPSMMNAERLDAKDFSKKCHNRLVELQNGRIRGGLWTNENQRTS